MTDDLVARLRYEQELYAVMGDTKAGTLVGEAADRLEAAEARVRELEAEVDAIRHDLERQMTIANVECNRAETAKARLSTIEAETIERCAKVADEHTIGNGDQYDDADIGAVICAETIATAIRKMPQDVKHEAD